MHDEYLIALVMQSAEVDREKALDLIFIVKRMIKYPTQQIQLKTKIEWRMQYQQVKAENLLLQRAAELREALCIGFNHSMALAREMNYTLTSISQWK